MVRSTALFLTLPVLTLTACQGETQFVTERYPELHLSVSGMDVVEFGSSTFDEIKKRVILVENLGDLPMGIKSIELQEKGMPDNFSLEYDEEDISCQAKATSKDVAVDTGGNTGDTGDTGADTADTGGEEPVPEYIVLDGGCRLPVTVTFRPSARGDLFAAMEVQSVTEPVNETSQNPTYFADPRNYKEVTIFHGEGLRGTGNIYVSPRLINFGDVFNLDEEFRYVFIENRGDGDLRLEPPQRSADCSEEFQLDLELFAEDGLLPAGDSTLFQINYAPFSTDAAECLVTIESDDPVEDVVEIRVRGNFGADPINEPPTVEIVSPQQGYVHDSTDPFEVQIRMNDPNQPATSLACTLRASAQVDGVLSLCSPEQENGFVTVMVDPAILEDGPEALLVEVTDLGGLSAADSISFTWNAPIPEGDDDGDGFGDDPDAGALFDCDDTNPNIHPGAAERPDTLDNNCDGFADEDTNFSDDDGDSVSEFDGDCNDRSRTTYPGAPELPDGADNDCDGIVDEGTALFDDDQDGFSDDEGDCDDRDPTVNPGQPELCDDDQVDENCNGYINRSDPDGCEAASSKPQVIGGCILEDRALNAGESTTATMFIYDPDTPPEGLRFDWVVSPEANVTVSSPNSGFTTLTWDIDIETFSSNDISRDYLVYALVFDGEITESPGQDWCSDEITVYTEDNPLVETVDKSLNSDGELETASTGTSGCSNNGEAALLLGPLFGLLALTRRRREQA
ncbi:MAG: putative metal-binding motif-containing protein [Myxococcota bacterium]